MEEDIDIKVNKVFKEDNETGRQHEIKRQI